MYQELVNKFELAIRDLMDAKKDQIISDLKNADMDSQYQVISFDIYDDDVHNDGLGWVQLSFGTRSDRDRYLNTIADWKYFNICNSDEVKTNHINSAVKAMSKYYLHPEVTEYEDWEPEYYNIYNARHTVLLFAAAQALLSPTVWQFYNQLQLSVYKEAREAIESEGQKSNYYIKNPLALDHLIEEASENKPILHCVVTKEDLSAEANYCEMVKAIVRIKANIDDVIYSINKPA